MQHPAQYFATPRLAVSRAFALAFFLFDVVWCIWFVGILEFVEALHEYHIVDPLFRLP